MLFRKGASPFVFLLLKSMNILINNQETQTVSANIMQLSIELNLPERGVALAVNNSIVPRTSWEETSIQEGDNITIIKAAFGG